MAASSLSPSIDGGTVEIVVPEKYVERFRAEALSQLGSAAQTIQDVANWTYDAKERGEEPKNTITADDLQRYRNAEVLFVEANADTDGDLTVEARTTVLHSAASGVLLDVSEELHGEAEKLQPDFGPVLEEFEFWRTLREQLDTEAAS